MTNDFCQYLIDLFRPWAEINLRKMFGGYGVYKNGLMFGIVADDVLYLKVDETNKADFEKLGLEAFSYEAKTRRVSMSYFTAPIEILEDESELNKWAEKSYQAAIQSKNKKATRARKESKK